MRPFLFLSFLLLAGATGYGQQLHFAYLQTDTHTPFYITFNKKNYSSTASGYIILPKLQNGDYAVKIGFAKSEETEQEFLLQVKDNDQGFLIKNFGDKGWGLFNLQTMVVQYAGTAAREKAKLAAAEKAEAEQRQRKLDEEAQATALKRRNDSMQQVALAQQSYTDSVAAVAAINARRLHEDSIASEQKLVAQQRLLDSAAKANAVAREAEWLQKSADSMAQVRVTMVEKPVASLEKPAEKVTETVKSDNSKSVTIPTPALAIPKKESTNATPAPVMIQQSFTDSGWHYAYNVTNNTHRETVKLFIPSAQPKIPAGTTVIEEKETKPVDAITNDSVKPLNTNAGHDTIIVEKNNTGSAATVEKPVTSAIVADTVAIVKNNVPANPPVDNPIVAGSVTPTIEAKDSIQPPAEKGAMNPNCRDVANEKDFLTARKKIAAAFGTDAMLVAAQKVLKQKCYTTDQLRNLCVLFLTDVARYQFLDLAYPSASDIFRYGSLQDLLTDTYFIQRFKAMLR